MSDAAKTFQFAFFVLKHLGVLRTPSAPRSVVISWERILRWSESPASFLMTYHLEMLCSRASEQTDSSTMLAYNLPRLWV